MFGAGSPAKTSTTRWSRATCSCSQLAIPAVVSERRRKNSVSTESRRAIVADVASTITHHNTPLWPDEVENDSVIYPFRIQLRNPNELGGFELEDLNRRFGAPVSDAVQMSANKQGQAEMVNVFVPRSETSAEPKSLRELTSAFTEATIDAGLSFGAAHDTLVRSFITALTVKPFVILTGLSGSGKTLLAKALGEWIGRVKIVAVRPDWTSPDALFGFENALSEPVDGRHSWNVPETLQFILEARDHPTVPHVLLLDEMNLAHVERYFADALSGMESEAPVVPNLTQESDGHHRAPTTRPDQDRVAQQHVRRRNGEHR